MAFAEYLSSINKPMWIRQVLVPGITDKEEDLLKLKDERVAVLEMRSHAAWYLKGLPGAQSVKNEIFRTKTSEELKNILNNYLKELKNNV